MKPRLTITVKLTLVFVLFAAVLLVGVGIQAYISGRAALQRAITSELLAAAMEKQAALDTWVEEKMADIAAIAADPGLARHIEAHRLHPDSAATLPEHKEIVSYLRGWTGEGKSFLFLQVMEPELGQVIASTSPKQEGGYKDDRPYFVHGKEGPFVQGPYYSLEYNSPAMTAAAPVLSADGRLLGVLAGHLNLDEVNAIISRRTGLYQTDDAFLVNDWNLFVTQPRLLPDPAVLQRAIHTEAVKRCLAHDSGTVLADDYRGVPVIAVYHWIPEHQICLVVDLDQVEAFAPTRTFGTRVLVIGSLAMLAAFALAFGLARTITRPVRALQAGAARLGRGELDVRLPETSSDELGHLAQEFNRMAASLCEKELQLRGYTSELEEKVRERTEALRQSEEQYRLLFDASPVGIGIADLGGQVLAANQSMLDLTGYSLDDLKAAGIGSLYPNPDDHRRLLEALQQAGRVRDWEVELGRPDGTVYSALLNVDQVLLRGQRILLTTARDITERRQAEEELRQRYRETKILNQVGVSLAHTLELPLLYHIACDHIAQLVDCPVFCISLYDSETRTLRPDFALSDGEPLDVSQCPPLPMDVEPTRGRARAVATGQAEIVEDLPAAVAAAIGRGELVTTVGDERVPLSALYVPMVVRGQVIGLVELQSYRPQAYSAEDVAVLGPVVNQVGLAIENARLYREVQEHARQLEQRVAERTAQLEETVRALETEVGERKKTEKELEAFSYSVSHDLRAPLRAIDGFSRILLEEYTPQATPEALGYLQLLRSNTQQMGRLIDDLLALSHLGWQPLTRQPVAPAALVRQVLADLHSEQEGRHVDVSIGDLPVCQADPGLLRQVFLNLLSNALKFTRRREVAVVEIGCREEKGPCVYFVRDNGVGFDMRYVHKLFGVFQRLHSAEEYEGTGVGLAIVQRIVHRHGGRVWAEAEVDKGATFYFTLGEVSHE